MLNLVIWFSGGLVSVRSEVGLGDLGGLFQPRQFCDSVTILQPAYSEENSGVRICVCAVAQPGQLH